MTVNPRVEAMLRADRAEASDLAGAEYMAALLAAADAVEGDRLRLADGSTVAVCGECGHAMHYSSCSRSGGGVEPSRETENEYDHGAIDSFHAGVAVGQGMAEARVVELTAALRQIVRLQQRWDAPEHGGDVYSERAWAALGSEAHKIANRALAAAGEGEESGSHHGELLAAARWYIREREADLTGRPDGVISLALAWRNLRTVLAWCEGHDVCEMPQNAENPQP